MRGWRAIRQELGLEGMVSARQLKKKWDNLKEKYRVLKHPPAGMERPGRPSWRWFQLMDEAASGHLAASGKLLEPSVLDDADDNTVPHFTFGDLAAHAASLGSDEEAEACSEVVVAAPQNVLSADVSEANGDGKTEVPSDAGGQLQPDDVALYATLLPEGLAADAVHSDDAEAPACGSPAEHEQLHDRRGLGPRSKGLERELAALERERAALERERAVLERDRAALERDRVCLDRDRAFLDRDRAFLERDRALLDRAREEAARSGSLLANAEEMAENQRAVGGDGEPPGKEGVESTRFCQNLMAIDVGLEQLESTQRLVSLFSKLVDKL
ncbi:uncharacterized protein LOC109518261 isoform X2 [Hippocampus comes]|nr:PREDICTED: uncharacterized protein LOC109518261 isoform X2 [Hippocampus comes]XP_019729566.1 PREDICTED: uncharacterized protein LOC109518261 isoform X2 [Hippocampus comes]